MISVIIPVYNGARFIRDALTSVCTQTYLPTEIVVADDASTDNTREVVIDFARSSSIPITLFTLENNTGGPYGPASLAFSRTRGKYVCILDADDMFTPDAFATYMEMFAADPTIDVGLTTSPISMFDDATGKLLVASSFDRHQHLLHRIIENLSPSGMILERDEAVRIYSERFTISFKGMLSRRAWIELGGPNLDYLHVCDVEFIWRFITQSVYRVRILNRPLVRVRVRQDSMSSQRLIVSRELVSLFRTMCRELPDPSLRAKVRMRLEKELFDLTYGSYKSRAYGTFLSAGVSLILARIKTRLVGS